MPSATNTDNLHECLRKDTTLVGDQPMKKAYEAPTLEKREPLQLVTATSFVSRFDVVSPTPVTPPDGDDDGGDDDNDNHNHNHNHNGGWWGKQ